MEKVNSNNRTDNCKYELNYAFDKKELKIMIVCMDDTMSNPRNWRGELKGKNTILFVCMNETLLGYQVLR